MSILLSLVFFLSGAAGLVFETLWFRTAGLTFGNSVWASSLVLSSFMGGLALGNGLAARFGRRVQRPLLGYAGLEIVVGVTGFLLVLLLPLLPQLLAPLFRPFLEQPAVLNPLRFGIAFVLLSVPTTAMGMTLPLMVKAMTQGSPDFGRALGRLYGLNALGAMMGAMAGEWWLLPSLGVTGTGLAAASMNALAAAGALVAHQRYREAKAVPALSEAPSPTSITWSGDLIRLLTAAMLAGAILIALEVVWFRFLQLFILSTTRGFALMLLVVLFGIGTGGLVSTLWLRVHPGAFRFVSHLSILAGLLTLWTYVGFENVPAGLDGARRVEFFDTLMLCTRLMLPVAFVSGILFTFVGRAVYESHREETGAVGWVTLFNTMGAALGALGAGWILLPRLGVETSLFLMALTYGVVALVVPRSLAKEATALRARAFARVLAAVLVISLVAFPFGLMRNHFVPLANAGYMSPDTEMVEFREGLTETISLLQTYWLGEPYSARLVTNSFSMTGTGLKAQRYMRYFAYWPLVFHERVEKALLISYGLGITADALTQSPELKQLDVVDISRDIVGMSDILYPDPETRPLNDPRVKVFIEDGRFYLLTTDERYDLITGEPPPLMVAGVVNLYTEEYFELMRNRLRDGGYVTYWLPAVHLPPAASRSIVKGFCNVFPDCSLWRGARLELVLIGSRGATGRIKEEAFARWWNDPAIKKDLETIGLESPGLLLSTFIADADDLEVFAADAEPLVDNYPFRLGRDIVDREAFDERVRFYIDFVKDDVVQERYKNSAYLRKRLPESLLAAGIEAFPYHSVNERSLNAGANAPLYFDELDHILQETELQTTALWLLGDPHAFSGVVDTLVAKNVSHPTVEYHLGLRALSERRYAEAAAHLAKAQNLGDTNPKIYYLRIVALAYADETDKAREAIAALVAADPLSTEQKGFWDFCSRKLGLQLPQS
ncbi:MAG: spermidine synthase [Acidobacteria bacterium]|nr:MAG: spermidine synthase [Acidobacteriota bacterium]